MMPDTFVALPPAVRTARRLLLLSLPLCTAVSICAAEGTLEEVIVTAQKRAESINDVPMSISALSADQLRDNGINSAADLARLVPGFSAIEGGRGAPIFTLRGVGFLDSNISASPTVSVYVDQVPIAYPVMTRLNTFDLERVEVLKGPQGTLFGSNSTGGAINFIPAHPAEEFSGGASLEYGRFDSLRVDGFATGPITENLSGRIAVQKVQSSDWQKDALTSETLGAKDQWAGRILLDWAATSTLSFKLNLSGWIDKSDAPAQQLLSVSISSALSCTPTRANYPLQCILPKIAAYPLASDARDAGFKPDSDYQRDDHFYLAAGRVDWELAPDIMLTSLSSYEGYREKGFSDGDGTPYVIGDGSGHAEISSRYQELRLASSGAGKLRWMIGANAQHDDVDQNNFGAYGDGTSVYAISPSAPVLTSNQYASTETKTYAGFGNIDYSLTDEFTLHAGARYTDSNIYNVGGHRDTGDGTFAKAFNLTIFGLTGTMGTIQPGGDFVLTLIPDPTSPTGLRATTGPIVLSLNESNVSWRVGLDFAPTRELLFYGNISRGFKAGSVPWASASAAIQHRAAVQEELLAYEVGAKATLLDNTLQLNSAIFYYDYTDKQLRGSIADPVGVFGTLAALVNVPESRVIGTEVQAIYEPTAGLTLSIGATYLDTKVTKSFVNADPWGNQIDFNDRRFPLTSNVSAVADVQYKRPLRPGLDAFVGASVKYQSDMDTRFYDAAIAATVLTDPLNAPGQTIEPNILTIDAYATVDARVGIAASDDSWRAALWVRNLTDEYHLNSIGKSLDTITATAGMPRTYGVSVTYRF